MNAKAQAAGTIPLVGVFYGDRQIGMYRARTVGSSMIVLRHGAISFPVGTALRLRLHELAGNRAIRKSLDAIVMYNSRSGMLLGLPGG